MPASIHLASSGAERARLIKKVPADLNAAASLRKVSLRGLEEAIEESLKSGKALPDEIVFLAGLQDIRYVFVYPEQKDIVLVGFGEGWRIDARGNFVGITTGKPVLLLDDLLTALRTAESSARSGISCSIDPTAEGIQQFRAYVATLTNHEQQESHLRRAGKGPGPAAGDLQRRAGDEPFCQRAGGGRLSHEAAGHELRAVAGPRPAQLPADVHVRPAWAWTT